MREIIKQKLQSILTSLCELHTEILQRVVNDVQENLQDCQQAAIIIGEIIEKEAPNEIEAISLLEKYCEELYYLSQEEIVSQEAVDRLNLILAEVNNRIEKIQIIYQVVFFPYKAEMWDSLESIWLACKKDKRCEAVVVPIPYYRYDADKKQTVPYYDGDKFPEYVPIVSYLEYSLQNELPEIAYIHNPYDKGNFVTSVHPAFYSEELKKYVGKLVYVPYYVTRGSISEQQSLLPAYLNMDYMVVQSEHFIKKNKHMFYYNRTLPLGSPKLDRVIRLCQEKEEYPDKFEYPTGWKEILNGKKSLMLNTSLGCFLHQGDVYLQKLFYLFSWVKNHQNIVIIWRPHPLLEATIHSLRQELLPKYRTLMAYFESEQIGILDTTPDVSRTVAIADGYIGEEWSSVVCLFGAVGKPQFILSNYIYKELEDGWNRRIRISDMVCCNGKYYLTTSVCNGLFSVENDWNRSIFKTRVEGQPKWCGSYSFLEEENNLVFFAPGAAFETAMYDCKNQTLTKAVPSSYYTEEKKFMSCRQVIPYKDKLFYLPQKNGTIWEYCRTTEAWKSHEQCIKDFRSNIAMEIYQNPADTLDYVQNGNCIYIVAGYTNRILCFDMESGKHKVYEVGNASYAYSAITGSDGIFWFAEKQSGKIIRWNLETDEFREIEMPNGFGCFQVHDGSYYVHKELFEMSSWVVSVPAFSNSMTKVHKITGEVSLCGRELWKEVDIPANDYHPKFHSVCCFAKKKDENTLWVQRTRDDALIEFNIETESYKIHYPTMTEESLHRLLQNEDGFERLDKDCYAFARRESRLFSLEDFIKDLVEGNLDKVRERQMEELSDFAANMDGTCGEKVHEFMMSVLEKEK